MPSWLGSAGRSATGSASRSTESEARVENGSKAGPGGPAPPGGDFRANLERAARAPSEHPKAFVRMEIDGAIPGEQYHFAFTAHPTGVAYLDLNDEQSKRAHKRDAARLAFGQLIRRIDIGSLLNADIPPPRFPPDSLVGRLELSDGWQQRVFYFMADPEQAKTAGYAMDSSLARAVEAIYGEAARQLRTADIRP